MKGGNKISKNVSDVITINDIKSWKQGEIVTITAGTGRGKSHFIMNKLYNSIDHFSLKGKILFLIHRNDPKEQFKKKLIRDKKTNLIDIKTYQHIETSITNGKGFDFSDYRYIVLDEFHRFLSDSFTATTDISLNAIINQSNAVKIMMSATGNYMMSFFREYMDLKTIEYAIPLEFSFINSLSYFKSDKTLETLVEEAILSNRKTVVFIDSVKKAYELHKKFKDDTLFNCSTTSSYHGYGKYVDEEKISDMLKNSRFEETVLITTTVMDTGVSLKDSELTQVICDVRDIVALGQCIGRKRIMEQNDYIDLIIKAHNGNSYRTLTMRAKKQCELANYLKKYKSAKFVKRYARRTEGKNNYFDVVYDTITSDASDVDKSTKQVNELVHYRAIKQLQEIDYMWKKGRNFMDGYCKYVALHFDRYDLRTETYDYEILEEVDHNDSLERHLNSIVGERLYKEGQKDLIDKVNLRDARGRVQKGVETINSYLKENNITYKILTKRTSERINGKITSIRYWEIVGDMDL